jgi:hypothetical protein
MEQNKQYILYDGRANVMNTDDCAILCTAQSKKEAVKYSRDFAEDSVWFEYDYNPKTKSADNECMWKTVGELIK